MRSSGSNSSSSQLHWQADLRLLAGFILLSLFSVVSQFECKGSDGSLRKR